MFFLVTHRVIEGDVQILYMWYGDDSNIYGIII